jgi:indole-3-glycerol phosphate synthase
MHVVSYLERILETKREEIEDRKRRTPVEELQAMPAYRYSRRSLRAALATRTPAVIAEIKGASPSRGVIRENLDPHEIALAYARAGAAAVSVLTDEPFFHGNIRYLLQARTGHELPVLRKDFIIDSYQLYEALAFGADAVLLIVAALGGAKLLELKEEAEVLGLEVLVEVHNEQELAALDDATIGLLGINNRNLSTFETSLDVTRRLLPHVPAGTLIVSESGIHGPSDLRCLLSWGVNAVLVGEAFMRAPDPGEALRAFLDGSGRSVP